MRVSVLLVAAALAAASGGCGSYVTLSSAEYSPQLQDVTKTYDRMHVYLETPQNNAENTSIFNYSGENGVRYGGPALTSYLWYALEKGMEEVGMVVHERPPEYPAPPIPGLKLTFTSWTAREFVGHLVIDGTDYERAIDVRFPEPPDQSAELAEHKAFAYRQIDLIIVDLLTDAAFAKAISGLQPPPPPGPQPAAAPAAAPPAAPPPAAPPAP